MQTTDPAQAVSAAVPFLPVHHGHRSPHAWPLRTGLELGPLPGAVPCGRAHVQQVLWEWGRAELGADAGLVVSELLTNAVVASQRLPQRPPVWLWLVSDTRLVLVLVADASQHPPVQLDPGPDAAGGRGLRLVEAMSDRWGWYQAFSPATAKTVWAEWGPPSGGREAS
jgi:Histidine kinase-like ATPase domain